jgi:hypothetical protein
MSTTRVRSLYGASDGTWLFVEGPVGVVPEPTIDVGIPSTGSGPGTIKELRHLGPPYEVFTRLCADVESMPTVGLRGPTGKISTQEVLGTLLGVSQQSISRYVNGASEPNLLDDDWRMLVRLSFDPSPLIAFMTKR